MADIDFNEALHTLDESVKNSPEQLTNPNTQGLITSGNGSINKPAYTNTETKSDPVESSSARPKEENKATTNSDNHGAKDVSSDDKYSSHANNPEFDKSNEAHLAKSLVNVAEYINNNNSLVKDLQGQVKELKDLILPDNSHKSDQPALDAAANNHKVDDSVKSVATDKDDEEDKSECKPKDKADCDMPKKSEKDDEEKDSVEKRLDNLAEQMSALVKALSPKEVDDKDAKKDDKVEDGKANQVKVDDKDADKDDKEESKKGLAEDKAKADKVKANKKDTEAHDKEEDTKDDAKEAKDDRELADIDRKESKEEKPEEQAKKSLPQGKAITAGDETDKSLENKTKEVETVKDQAKKMLNYLQSFEGKMVYEGNDEERSNYAKANDMLKSLTSKEDLAKATEVANKAIARF